MKKHIFYKNLSYVFSLCCVIEICSVFVNETHYSRVISVLATFPSMFLLTGQQRKVMYVLRVSAILFHLFLS
jgi:hypothetical protein